MHEAVKGLNQAYLNGGKPRVTFDEPSDVGSTDFGHVKLNQKLITDNLKYAAALFHEYRHAWQYESGKYYKWQSNYPASYPYSMGIGI